MGLDMYFYKKSYVKNWEHTPAEQRHNVSVSLNDNVRTDIKPERVSTITEEVAYWRKFNALHNWFVRNCADGIDECQNIDITLEDINNLLDVMREVKASLDASPKKTASVESGWANGKKAYADVEVFADTSVAHKLFPTSSGFFFGGIEYDQWYYNSLVETIKTFENLINESKVEGAYSPEYYYRASW